MIVERFQTVCHTEQADCSRDNGNDIQYDNDTEGKRNLLTNF